MFHLKSGFVKFFFFFLLSCYSQETEVRDGGTGPPEDCNSNLREALDSYETVEDFDRCAPFLLPDYARIYFEAASGRQVTIRENKLAYKRLQILPKILRDVSHLDLGVTVLGQRLGMPIAVDPVAFQKLASDLGEVDTAKAAYEAGTVMILSSLSSTLIEDVARATPGSMKWMQTYIFPNRSLTIDLVKRAEAAKFKAIVVTVDSPIQGPLPNKASGIIDGNPKNVTPVNIGTYEGLDASLTFEDLAWLKRKTRLPIIAKGILTPADAVRAAEYGASAILVSNHGGRQLDSVPATTAAFVNGFDVFKALARGAQLTLVGRPIIWGLAAGGQRGVSKVLGILRRELNETMTLAGTPNLAAIDKNMVVPVPWGVDRSVSGHMLSFHDEDGKRKQRKGRKEKKASSSKN